MGSEIKMFEHAGNITEDKNAPAARSSEYPDFTEKGVELAREKAEELAAEIEKAEPGTIIWLGGNSHIPRSKTTLKIISGVLGDKFQKSSKDDILLYSQKELREIANSDSDGSEEDKRQSGYTFAMEKMIEDAKKHPDAKMIIDMPLRIKQISQKDWYVQDGKLKEYQDELCKDFDLFSEYGENYTNATKKWFREPDTTEDGAGTPNPEGVAKSYLQGLQRLVEFIRKYAPDRPVKIVAVGHSFEINALLTFLANEGKVSEDGLDKIGGSTIGFTESATIEINNNEIRTTYRDKDFKFKIPENI